MLKFSGRMAGGNSLPSSGVSKRINSVVVPIKSASDDEYCEIPDNVFINNNNKSLSANSFTSSKSSYWSWTFGITTFPFILWGCPFYLVLIERSSPIRTTWKWLKSIFDCSVHPFATLVSSLLLVATLTVNGYVIYLFSALFSSLFITGVYEESVFYDLIDFLRDVPIVIPLNYIWLWGYKINNIISLLNQKHRMYSQIACGGYRFRLIAMLLVIACVHVTRYFSYKKYSFQEDLNFMAILHTIWEFSVDIFVTLMLPVYCAFCYAVRFELSIIKASVYEMITKRVIPNISHLSKFKMLYTHAADHINTINNIFSIYLSLTILLTIVGTIVDAKNLIAGVGGIMANIFGKLFGGDANDMAPSADFFNNTVSQLNDTLSESDSTTTMVRQVNADVACIILVYVLIFFTIWQAAVTNDWAREVHVWLNDFVAGAGGSDAKELLMDLGVVQDDDIVNNISSGLDDSLHDDQTSHLLIWARNRKTDDGNTDQFLEKFRMLKSYIHVRMQLEKPALLTVTLVGVFIPSLSGRLRRYHILF